MKERIKEIILASAITACIAGGIGFYLGKGIYTPRRAWTTNPNGIEEVVIEARNGERATLYNSSTPENPTKEYVSGEEISKGLNEAWRNDYMKRNGQMPNFNHYDMHTKWELMQ